MQAVPWYWRHGRLPAAFVFCARAGVFGCTLLMVVEELGRAQQRPLTCSQPVEVVFETEEGKILLVRASLLALILQVGSDGNCKPTHKIESRDVWDSEMPIMAVWFA